MSVVQNEKNRNIKGIVCLFVLIGVICVLLAPSMTELFIKFKIQGTKEETKVTMTLTKDEIYHLEREQRELANRYEKDHHWLYKEILDTALRINNNYDFFYDHPEYDLVKIKFKVKSYEIDSEKIKFISNEGKIVQAHSDKGWIDK